MEYLGAISLIALAVLGFNQVNLFIIIPFAVVNAFVGLHYPPGKAEMLKARHGEVGYLKTLIGTVPIQGLFALVVYGGGYLVGFLFS